MTVLEKMQPALRSLLNLENELRSAARNALILRSDEAKSHMAEARRHYLEAIQAIKKELRQSSFEGSATAATGPDRDRLGPTGPAEVKRGGPPSNDEKHPHAGKVPETTSGPMPTDDPDNVVSEIHNSIEKKRAPPT